MTRDTFWVGFPGHWKQAKVLAYRGLTAVCLVDGVPVEIARARLCDKPPRARPTPRAEWSEDARPAVEAAPRWFRRRP